MNSGLEETTKIIPTTYCWRFRPRTGPRSSLLLCFPRGCCSSNRELRYRRKRNQQLPMERDSCVTFSSVATEVRMLDLEGGDKVTMRTVRLELMVANRRQFRLPCCQCISAGESRVGQSPMEISVRGIGRFNQGTCKCDLFTDFRHSWV